MKFTSLEFVLFLPFTFLVYVFLPRGNRWMWLLIASCFFYSRWVPSYLLVMIFLALLDWTAGISIQNTKSLRVRKFILWSAVAVQILQLGFFKYYAFFIENINLLTSLSLRDHQFQTYHWLLPLGLSFHTFQSISYLTDIYRRQEKAEPNFFKLLFFIIFFPQLVAGPIERANHLLKQVNASPRVQFDLFSSGIALIFYGFFKKLVIADSAALYVDTIYADHRTFLGAGLWLANYMFWIQIYFDFSGYIAIAQGSAQLFGYTLVENFNQPYFSRSISDFWQRWHISLSAWFRDYVYNPLMMSGQHISFVKLYVVTIFVFFLSGLWHGPNWTYVMFGLFHGLCIACSFYFKSAWNKVYKIIKVNKKSVAFSWWQIFITFHLVLLSWILFRSENLVKAKEIFYGLFVFKAVDFSRLTFPNSSLKIIFASLLIVFVWSRSFNLLRRLFNRNSPQFYFISLLLFCYFLLTARLNSQDFIYFQF